MLFSLRMGPKVTSDAHFTFFPVFLRNANAIFRHARQWDFSRSVCGQANRFRILNRFFWHDFARLG